MSSANRYNSIVETMKGTIILPTVLSTFGTVPGTITVPAPMFTVPCRGTGIGGLFAEEFDLNDVPNILTIGLWSNLADGLSPINWPTSVSPAVTVEWYAIDGGGSPIGAPLARILTYYPQALNRQEAQNFFRVFNNAATRAALENRITLGAVATRLDVSLGGAMSFDAYSMSSAWNVATFMLEVQLEVEHTLPLR